MTTDDNTNRVETTAVAHFKRTGLILPGHQGEIAAWLAANNHDGDERPTVDADADRSRGGA